MAPTKFIYFGSCIYFTSFEIPMSIHIYVHRFHSLFAVYMCICVYVGTLLSAILLGIFFKKYCKLLILLYGEQKVSIFN